MRAAKIMIPLCLFVIAVMGVNAFFVSPSNKAYAASTANCGTQQTTVDTTSLSSILSTNVQALTPNSCFQQAFKQCNPATLGYDVKAPGNSLSVQLATHNPTTGGCAVSASVFGVSMTCVLNNSEPLTQSLLNTAQQKFANCSGLLTHLIPKNITIPAAVVTASADTTSKSSDSTASSSTTGDSQTASSSGTTGSDPADSQSTSTTATADSLPDTGAGNIVPLFVAAALLGAFGYRKFLLRSAA